MYVGKERKEEKRENDGMENEGLLTVFILQGGGAALHLPFTPFTRKRWGV